MKQTAFYFKFPGDPVEQAVVLTGLQFKQQNPNRETKIITKDETKVIPIPYDRVLCDSCGKKITDNDVCYLTRNGNYLDCEECAKRSIIPYKLQSENN